MFFFLEDIFFYFWKMSKRATIVGGVCSMEESQSLSCVNCISFLKSVATKVHPEKKTMLFFNKQNCYFKFTESTLSSSFKKHLFPTLPETNI